MKEFRKNFNKILGEMFSKLFIVGLLLITGMVFGTAFTLTVLGITPQIFSEILADYNATPILLVFMMLAVSAATVWQFTSMSYDVTDDVVAV